MDLIAVKKGICTGCTACLYACPNACIDMQEDKEGFLYPVIDQEVCFNCNACNTQCPAIKPREEQKTESVYAAINPDQGVREESTSGGVFTVLANHFLGKGGVIYGAALDEDNMVKHVRATNPKELEAIRKSKYVQSHLGFVYELVENDLMEGKYVLFTGTPCQIDGLKATLLKDYDTLLTCAVVCHGVPSPGVYRKYLKSMEAKLKEPVRDVNFRKRAPSWRQYALAFYGDHHSHISPAGSDAYMKGFVQGVYERPSCHQCPSKPNTADILIGDYWGVEHFHPEMDDNRGTSVVIVQTPKGTRFFDAVKEHLTLEVSSFQSAIAQNPAIVKSGKASKKREAFFTDYATKDFDALSKKHLSEPKWVYMKRVVKHVLKKILGYFQPTKEK